MNRRHFGRLVGLSLFAPLAIPKKKGLTVEQLCKLRDEFEKNETAVGYIAYPIGTMMCYADDARTILRPADSRLGDTSGDIVCAVGPSGPITRDLAMLCFARKNL